MSNEQMAKVVEFWRAVELFSPQQVPKLDASHRYNPVYAATDGSLPWDVGHPAQRRRPPKFCSRRFQVYCGVFALAHVKELLEERLGRDEESFDDRIDGENCLFAFSMTDDGRPLFDSFTLYSCAWAASRTRAPGAGSSVWLQGFDALSVEYAKRFTESLAVLVDDEKGNELVGKGFSIGRALRYEDIFQETVKIARGLKLEDFCEELDIRVKISWVSARKKWSTDDLDFLNSFFVKDLGLVAEKVRGGHLGTALNSFLTKTTDTSRRVDVREDSDVLYEILSPEYFPSGRWPCKGHFPLVFSQQFAVNSMMKSLSARGGVFPVNGPPGTGKTTLLRDVIAAIVVERAKQLSKCNNHDDGFFKKYNWKCGTYNRAIWVLNDEIRGFEIVIASNNNGAVENVTLEIPGKEAIDESYWKRAQYFSEYGTNLIGETAWGLTAARLGNKVNRSEFIDRFWFTKKSCNDETGEEEIYFLGFLDHLKWCETQTFNWKAAVSNFQNALRNETRLRKERSDFYSAFKAVPQLKGNITALMQQRVGLQKHSGASFQRLEAICFEETTIRQRWEGEKLNRLEYQHFKPGFWAMVFSFGRLLREWMAEDDELKARVKNIERCLQDVKQKREEAELEHESVVKRIQECEKGISALQERLATMEKILAAAQKKIGAHFPDSKMCANDEDCRELSSPWADPEWNGARAEVFIAAMQLHRVFIESNATKFRQTLQGMMDILGGNVPSNASPEAIRAAWAAFFVLIPVVSTTFASFDRLFAHIGSEGLGWLLIDEAGQGTSQSAVGAIWRARHSVIVGDPMQLEPVITIPFTTQQALRTYFKVSETWLPSRTSVQQLADRVSVFGTNIRTEDGLVWVGAPLRVHRRCDHTMFDISNNIAYDGLMVFGTSVRDTLGYEASRWLDVRSDLAQGHWIPEEGDTVITLINALLLRGAKPSDIFLISPFRAVVSELRQIARQYHGLQAGTIHTVQGKEADIVIVVLGGDPRKPGAKNWAAKKPNLLNVAASRAKRRLYVIGNEKEWSARRYFQTASALLKTN